MGRNMKFEMVMDVPVGELDETDEFGPADSPPPPKAMKRRAPANTRMPVPILTRRSIASTPLGWSG
jgi:hypothetical protein